jgi:hypothetical protein
MKWRRIDKTATSQPATGGYADWKPILAAEAQNQCVYCCISDAHFGGIRNFHVEHYRPKKKFPELELVIANLFYACSICNVFKGDDWPNEPGNAVFDYPHYPDPSVIDYAEMFTVNPISAQVEGANVTARYLIEKLHLNRAQVLRNRKLNLLADQLKVLKDQLNEVAQTTAELDECRQAAGLLNQIADLFHNLWMAIPYDAAEARR